MFSRPDNLILATCFCLLFLFTESGCRYYSVISSDNPGSNNIKEVLEKDVKQDKNILIYDHGKYYSLSNLKYNEENTILVASCKIDSSRHLYNPYSYSPKKYRSRKGEQKILKEVFIISDSVAISHDSVVTIPLSSIVRIDHIKNNPARGAGNVSLVILGLAGVGIIILGSIFGFGGGGGYM